MKLAIFSIFLTAYVLSLSCKPSAPVATLSEDTSRGKQVAEDYVFAEEHMQMLPRAIPCHQMTQLRYNYPTGIYMYHDGRDIALRWGFRNNELPIGARSLEFQEYQRGEKARLIPLVPKGRSSVTHWALYRPVKVPILIREFKRYTQGRSSTPSKTFYDNKIPDYDWYNKARPMSDIYVFRGYRDDGKQSPYIEKQVESLSRGAGGSTSITKEIYWYENCELSRIIPVQPQEGEGLGVADYCKGKQFQWHEITDPNHEPRCLGDVFASDAYGIRNTLENLDKIEATIKFVGYATPIVGTTLNVIDCYHQSTPRCWSEAGVSAISDVLIVGSVARVSNLGRLAAASGNGGKVERTLLMMNAAGNTGLAIDDFRQGKYAQGFGRAFAAGMSLVMYRWSKEAAIQYEKSLADKTDDLLSGLSKVDELLRDADGLPITWGKNKQGVTAFEHVYEGEFAVITQGAKKGTTAIAGGIHSDNALARAAEKGIRPERVEELANGVRRVYFNPDQFTSSQLKQMNNFLSNNQGYTLGGKTLFPQSWTKADIVKAARKIVSEGSSTSGSLRGVYNNVTVQVNMAGGKIQTVFPYWFQ